MPKKWISTLVAFGFLLTACAPAINARPTDSSTQTPVINPLASTSTQSSGMLMIGTQTQGTAGTPTHKVTATSIASPDPGLIPSPGTLQLPDGALARLGKGTIEDYAISPDGKYLATVGTMGVFLYQMDTFNQVWGWFYQSGWEYVEFSKGGNLLLVHSYDSYSMLFDVGTGKLLRMVTDGYYGPRGPGGSIAALSPDGKTYAFAEPNISMYLIDTGTGETLSTMDKQENLVDGLVFSPDGNTLASSERDYSTGGTGSSIVFWDPATGQQKASFLQSILVGVLIYSPDGKLLAMGSSDDGTIALMDTNTGKRFLTLKSPEDRVVHLAFSSDGKTLASDEYGDTTLWDTTTGMKLRTLNGYQVAFAPDGKTLCFIPPTGDTVICMDIQTGKQLRQLDGYIGTTQSMVFSPDGKMLASSSGGSKVLLWDVAQRTYLPIKIENDSPVSSLAFTPDGTSLVTGAGNGSILFWDPATGMQHNTFNLPNGQVSSMAFSSDGRMLALGFEDGRTSLWDPATWKLLRAFTGLAKPVEGLVISADGKTLSATTQNTLILWNTETGAQINSANGWAMAISSDGKQCAYEAGDPMRYFSLYDARTGRQLHKLDNVYAMGAYVSTASFSPDGKIIALGISTCGTDACTISISLHDVATGYPLTVFTGVDGGLVASTNINRLVFSPDGKVLASNSDDGTITLWDTSEIDK